MGREVTPSAANASKRGEGARPARVFGGSPPSRARPRFGAVAAVLPWLFASALTAATMSVELTPRPDELRLDAPPGTPRRVPGSPSTPAAPPASGRGRGGSDDLYFDVRALISV